jgi:hypothetical protein
MNDTIVGWILVGGIVVFLVADIASEIAIWLLRK